MDLLDDGLHKHKIIAEDFSNDFFKNELSCTHCFFHLSLGFYQRVRTWSTFMVELDSMDFN